MILCGSYLCATGWPHTSRAKFPLQTYSLGSVEWIKTPFGNKPLVWQVCVRGSRQARQGSSIRLYFTVLRLRHRSECGGRLCWQNQSSDPAVSGAHVCLNAPVCVCVPATVTRAKAALLLRKLGVFREEWRVRWKQRGLGFMKSINHRDSTTLCLSPFLLCHRKF